MPNGKHIIVYGLKGRGICWLFLVVYPDVFERTEMEMLIWIISLRRSE